MAPEELIDQPVWRNFDSAHLLLGGGVAIFHLATSRVVVIRHSRENYWFLPKGRRDVSEESADGAEREGFEESGYRNRLLPIPIPHLQPRPHNSASTESDFVTEPIQTQFFPASTRRRIQYVIHWYIAETLPQVVEDELNAAMEAKATKDVPTPYINPPPYPKGLSIADRIEMDGSVYMPRHHPNTGVDDDERLYETHLLSVDDAIQRLSSSSRMLAEIVRAGWDAIRLRGEMEAQSRAT